MIGLKIGRYSAREATSPEDVRAAQALRARCFGLDRATATFDAHCAHILITRTSDGALVCCFRMMPLCGADISRSYSAQYYELSALEAYGGKMGEMGRFCVDPEVSDPDILRVAWAALTAYVDTEGVEMLFGCASFAGTDDTAYHDAFALLKERHLAPKRWLPRVKAPRIFPFAAGLSRMKPDLKRAMQAMPPLLRTYLLMGGWGSDHAVVDRDLNTLHVFTGLEIGAIPPARARLLRATATA